MPRSRLLACTALVTTFLVGAPTSGTWATSLNSPAPSTADVKERVRRSFERSVVPGMVAVVVHGDDVVWSGGFGTASDGAPMTAGSRVQVASVTKSFTATAVLDLVEDGRIDLDGTVASQLAGFVMADRRAGQVTVRHLLNHTSGLTDAGTGFYAAVDLDLGIPRTDIALLVAHLAGRLDVSAADHKALRPLPPPAPPVPTMPATCANLWLRAGGVSPWE